MHYLTLSDVHYITVVFSYMIPFTYIISCIAPAQIVDGPTHLAVKRGETITPKFEFVGIPRPEIYWTKGITEMEVTERICTEVTEEYAALTISDVEPEDAGDYTVITENLVGRDERTFKLDVYGKITGPCCNTCNLDAVDKNIQNSICALL